MFPFNNQPVKKFQVECGCKSVKLFLKDTPDVSNYSKQISTYCHCRDCVNFPTACYQAAQEHGGSEKSKQCIDVVDHKNDGCHHVWFHDSNIEVMRGGEHIQWHKNHANSLPKRFYASCCGTPLGIRVMGVVLIYGRLLAKQDVDDVAKGSGQEFEQKDDEEDSFEVPPPLYAGSAGSAKKDKEHDQGDVALHEDHPGILVYDGTIGLGVILHILTRKIIAGVRGKTAILSPSMQQPSVDAGYTIGLEPSDIRIQEG